MKKTVLKRILIAVSFVAILLLCYAYLAMILMPKDLNDMGGEKYFSATSYKSEQDHTLDFAFLGNSDVYSGFSPVEFYKQTGSTSYVCSAPKQSAHALEENVKYLTKHHDLKLLIIDVDCLFSRNYKWDGTSIYKFSFLIAPYKYHARWKELEWKDFYTLPELKTDPLKGYMPRATVSKFTLAEGYMANVDAAAAKIEKSVVKNVNNVAELCKQNNIELLFVCLPTPHSWNNAKSNAVANLANETGVPFVDLNFQTDDYNLDYANSFRDNGNHLNVFGATYTTNYLVHYLTDHYDLPDHRGEEKYVGWNDLIDYYDNYVASLIESEQ